MKYLKICRTIGVSGSASCLSQIQVPRCYLVHGTVRDISLHLISDAFKDGYGTCAYLRFVYVSETVRHSFSVGSSRSSPVRPISFPRFKLQAATLCVKICRVLMDELTDQISNVTFWADSQTTLQHIKNKTKRFQTYVANRVAEIREVTSPDQWRYCPGKVNPQKLSSQYRWWRGPDFLWESEGCWPSAKYEEVPDSDREVRAWANAHPVSLIRL